MSKTSCKSRAYKRKKLMGYGCCLSLKTHLVYRLNFHLVLLAFFSFLRKTLKNDKTNQKIMDSN